MIHALAGALLVAVTPAEALVQAQAAFSRHDYLTADTLATQAAQGTHRGAALYLAGLSRFRSGRPREALDALDEAGRSADPPEPGLWHYNRAACLYDLERFAEAEIEYQQAATLDRSIATVSLVNAGFAALDAGAAERATALAQRARETASDGAFDLVVDLERQITATRRSAIGNSAAETEYSQGLLDYDRGRYESARAHFARAMAADPADTRSRIMAGATALKLGALSDARSELDAVLSHPLALADAQIARDYLASLGHGLAARGRGLALGIRIGAGFDTNYLQSGPVDFGTSSATPAVTPIATATLAGVWRARPSSLFATELSYQLDQLAYLSSAAADYSVQQHSLLALGEIEPRGWLRFGASVVGEYDFAGLSGFRTLQAGGGAGAWAAIDEHAQTTSRLGIDWLHMDAPRSEFAYLSGDRLDLSFAQSLRLGATTTDLEYRYRDEGIGTLTEPMQLTLPPGVCPPDRPCPERYVIPFGYTSHTLALSFHATPVEIVRAGVSVGVEWRTYASDSYLDVTLPEGLSSQIDHRLRQDVRFFGQAFGTVRVWRTLDLSLTYDFVVNTSNVEDSLFQGPQAGCLPPDFVCHQLDYDDKNYTKHVLLFETGYSW
jgi:tetratricopeptide (TPR) repeat protein